MTKIKPLAGLSDRDDAVHRPLGTPKADFTPASVPLLLLLSLGHLAVDANAGGLPVLLPVLRETYNLSFTTVGSFMLVSSVASSLIQPFFGLISDRIPTRWLLPVSCLVAALGYGLLGIGGALPVIVLAIFLQGSGVAAYHPEASKLAHYAAGSQKGKALSLFAIGGNVGVALGPLIMGTALALFGMRGSFVFILLTLPVVLILWRAVPALYAPLDAAQVQADPAKSPEVQGSGQDSPGERAPGLAAPTAPTRWRAMSLLLGVITMRSWIHTGLITLIPLYAVTRLGLTPSVASTLLTVFLIAGAVGTIVGGPASDRWGSRRVILWSMVGAIPLVALIPYVSGIATYGLLALTGFVLVASFAVTTVLGQEIMSNQVGLASGLTLGFSVGTGGIGATLLGVIADRWNIEMAITCIVILPIIGTILALMLRSDERSHASV